MDHDENEKVEFFEDRRAMRAELDRLHFEKLKKLEHKVEELEEVLSEFTLWKEKHVEQYQIDQPTLSVLRHIAGFSVVLRWVVIAALGLLSAIGATQLAFETLHKWFIK